MRIGLAILTLASMLAFAARDVLAQQGSPGVSGGTSSPQIGSGPSNPSPGGVGPARGLRRYQ